MSQSRTTAALLLAALSPLASPADRNIPISPYGPADTAYGRILLAKSDADSADMQMNGKQAVEPFHILGDVYYVGVRNFASYLVRTSEGLILMDTTWSDTAPQVAANIEQLGFKLTDIRYILTTEGSHKDHNGGAAYMKARTGARLWVMDGDAELLAKGRPGPDLPPAQVDRTLHDGDRVTLGGKTLTAYHVPGHTPGGTTWVWQESEGGKRYTVADVCCWALPANHVSHPSCPLERFRKDWAILKSLDVDVPLGNHAPYFDVLGKAERARRGQRDAWVDKAGFRGMIAVHEQDFEAEVTRQLRDGPPPAPTGLVPSEGCPAPR